MTSKPIGRHKSSTRYGWPALPERFERWTDDTVEDAIHRRVRRVLVKAGFNSQLPFDVPIIFGWPNADGWLFRSPASADRFKRMLAVAYDKDEDWPVKRVFSLAATDFTDGELLIAFDGTRPELTPDEAREIVIECAQVLLDQHRSGQSK